MVLPLWMTRFANTTSSHEVLGEPWRLLSFMVMELHDRSEVQLVLRQTEWTAEAVGNKIFGLGYT